MLAHDRENIQILRDSYTNWIHGFVSSSNFLSGQDIGANLSAYALYFSVLNQCRDDPTLQVATATAIMMSLERAKQQPQN